MENQGRAVLTAQGKGSLRPAFTAADCTDQTVITGADGVMVPLVTEEQKDKRRQTEAAKRNEQGRASAAGVGRPKQGSDGPYNEFKVLTFYDPDKSHVQVVATSGNHEALGRLMRREARSLQLGQAKTKYAPNPCGRNCGSRGNHPGSIGQGLWASRPQSRLRGVGCSWPEREKPAMDG